MSAFHPTRRELILILVMTLLLGLFLQFDLSLHFRDSSGSDSLFGLQVGFGSHRDDDWDDSRVAAAKSAGAGKKSSKDKWLEDVKKGAEASRVESGTEGMADSRVHWDEAGVRTKVLAHAPGEWR